MSAHLPSTHDELTGLPGRHVAEMRLNSASVEADRSAASFAAFLIDLDSFRLVNDSLGYAAGDALLRAVAERLAASRRAGETLARLGGDEFLLIVEPIDGGQSGAVERARLLHAALAEPFTVSGVELYVAATIGIVISRGDAGADLLLKRAEIAVNRAIQDGEPIAVFADDDAKHRRTLTLTARLGHAVERDELELHYQPIRRADDESVSSLEALLRWRPDGDELMPPGEFIPLAESSGLIESIGEWVIDAAGRQCRAWRDAGLEPTCVNVNVSPRQLRRTDVPSAAAAALREHDLAPGSLTIELTETAVQNGSRRMEDELQRLRELGVRLAIDDFGADYSSLARLRDLPFDVLKIDRAFVRGVPDDPRAGRLLEAIVRLADALDLVTCVEGVEDETQVDVVRRAGAGLIQGFFYSRPLPADRVAAQLPPVDGAPATTAIRSRKSGAHIASATPAA